MCGIAGIIGLADRTPALDKINAMSESLRHRGPDADGCWVAPRVALAHRRLSIIDLSDSGNQPLHDASGRFAIVFNGEIYNYREIKRSFPDYPYVSDSDTEVILAAYAAEGPAALARLNGMFALAIWDRERDELFVARDRLGVKPLYYALTTAGNLVFASEIRAVLASGLVPRRLNRSGLYDYLMYQSVYAPQTIVEGIAQLPAGQYGIFRDSRLALEPFWQIEANEWETVPEDETKIKKNVRRLLLKSVEIRMISDVPLGAFLSGGIDSSAVVALMSETSTTPINTFSVGFAEKKFDESPYAQLIADKYKTNHTSVYLGADDFLHELPAALRAADSPSGDGLNTYVVSKATKRAGMTVALSGLGGDELFAGYRYFQQWLKIRSGLLNKIPGLLRRPAAHALSFSASSKYQRIADLLSSDKLNLSDVYPTFRQVMSQAAADELWRGESGPPAIRRMLSEKAARIDRFPLLSQLTIAELLGYTQNVLLKDIDQFSMASALEVREPFFDFELIEYVLRVPDRYKTPQNTRYPKSLLVESLGTMLPPEIFDRPKMGFVLPFESWMRRELRGFCAERLTKLAAREILDPRLLMEKWNRFLKGSGRVRWSELWHLVVLTEWLENNNF
jgi:asparagine synthase (glutamine-hydrolysing)